jgi:hypothetical protein
MFVGVSAACRTWPTPVAIQDEGMVAVGRAHWREKWRSNGTCVALTTDGLCSPQRSCSATGRGAALARGSAPVRLHHRACQAQVATKLYLSQDESGGSGHPIDGRRTGGPLDSRHRVRTAVGRHLARCQGLDRLLECFLLLSQRIYFALLLCRIACEALRLLFQGQPIQFLPQSFILLPTNAILV